MSDWWWREQAEGKAHKGVFEEMERLKGEYSTHRDNIFTCLRHYSNKYYLAALRGSFGSFGGKKEPTKARNPISLNLIRNCVDTLVGKITKNPFNITVLPLKNDPRAEKGAKGVEKFLKGQIRHLEIFEALRGQFRHAAITGTGWVKVYFDPNKGESGEVCIEPVLGSAVLIPPEFSTYGKTPVIYEVRQVNKYEFAEYFPEFKKEILEAQSTIGQSSLVKAFGKNTSDDGHLIEVVEGWYVKSPECPEGRHVICLQNTTLLEEAYDEEQVPLIPMYFNKPPVGMWGIGVAEITRSLQIELNALLMSTSENTRLFGRPKWFVAKGSMIPHHHLTNKAEIVEYNAAPGINPPSMQVGNPTPPQVIELINWYVGRIYHQLGLSEMSATSQKPQGLNSGVAIQAAVDLESERFIELQQEYERVGLKIIEAVLRLCKKNYKPDDNRIVKSLDRDSFELVAFNELKIEEINYMINIQPMSFLPETRAGKIQWLMDMVQLGVIQDPSIMLDYMEFPNADKIYQGLLVDKKLADQYIEILMDPDEPFPEPDAMENQRYMIDYINKYWKSRRFTQDSDEIKERFQRHIVLRAQMIPPEPQPTTMMPPEGGPGPT